MPLPRAMPDCYVDTRRHAAASDVTMPPLMLRYAMRHMLRSHCRAMPDAATPRRYYAARHLPCLSAMLLRDSAFAAMLSALQRRHARAAACRCCCRFYDACSFYLLRKSYATDYAAYLLRFARR